VTSFETQLATNPLFFDRATGFLIYVFTTLLSLPVFSDDDTRVKLIKGKNDYVNANYVKVSFFFFVFAVSLRLVFLEVS